MLEIGKTQDVFRAANESVSTMITAKTKDNFKKAKGGIKKWYTSHINSKKSTLNNFQLRAELIHDPRQYTALPDQRPPTNGKTIMKEQILTFDQYLSSLNILKCSVCMECKTEAKPLVDDPNYICSKCNIRKDPDFFLKTFFI